MTERYVVIDQLKSTYEGYFDMNGLFNLIDSWLFEKGYDKNEKKNEEIDCEDGTKSLYIELRPWKKLTNYTRLDLKIKLYVSDLKDVEIERAGNKIKINEGKVQMVFSAGWTADYQERWNDKPFLFFMQVIYDKYFYKYYTKKFKAGLFADVNDVTSRIKNFLNVHRYGGQHIPQWDA